MNGVENQAVTDVIPTALQVELELARIFAAAPFRDAPQLKAFLLFVVRETLAGRGGDLKGYSIATLALGRPDSFDPQTDPIVRVQAGRVRQALAEFYEANPTEPTIISLERGSYLPRFACANQTSGNLQTSSMPDVPDRMSKINTASAEASLKASPSQPFLLTVMVLACAVALVTFLGWRAYDGYRKPELLPYSAFVPSLIVELDAHDAASELGVLASRTRDAIARFDDVVVVQDNADMAAAMPGSSGARPGIRLSLKIGGAPAGPGQMRVTARLIDRSDQTLLWSREFDPVPAGPAGDRQRGLIVRATASSIAQPYGAIHAHVRARLKTRQIKGDPYDCIVASFDYWLSNDAKAHLAVRQCLEDRLAVYDSAAPLHAQMTYLHLEEHRQGYNVLPGNALDRALQSAQSAVQRAPASARAHQALLAAHFARSETDLAWRAAGEAMQLNPYDTEILEDVGARHVQSGHYEKGLELLQKALDLNNTPPTWAVTFRVIALYMLGRTDQSGPMALTLRGSDYPMAMVALVMGTAQARDMAGASAALERLNTIHPAIASNLQAYLKKLAYSQTTIQQIIVDFERARDWIASGKQ